MFKKLKGFAKKAVNKIIEVTKHIVEKVEEYIMAKEEVKVKIVELTINTAKDICHSIYEHPVIIMVSGAGASVAIGSAIILDKKYNKV